jgi:hypothetical protein
MPFNELILVLGCHLFCHLQAHDEGNWINDIALHLLGFMIDVP